MAVWKNIGNMFKLLFGFNSKTTTTTTIYNSTIPSTGGVMKRALHIGINDYPGTQNDLRGCINDANQWKETASRKGFNSFVMLLNDQATRSNVKNEMIKIISESKDGDTLLITYSGHGSKVADSMNGDEEDKVDETWYLYNGNFVDDEIREILSKIPQGVKATIVSDSCHSGSITRALLSTFNAEGYSKPRYMPPENIVECAVVGSIESSRAFAYPESGMNHILIAGASSTEYSYDAFFDKPMGALTYYATQIIDANPNFTYNQFYDELMKKLPSARYPQTPQLEGPDSLKNSIMF